MSELIFLKPVFKEMIWGGNKMKSSFGYPIDNDDTGECWAISAHANGDDTVLNGRFAGKTLSSLWNDERESVFGGFNSPVFPLLTKIIDAKSDLSVQVHPDDAYAAANENGSLGKTECWYILDCEPGTEIVVGHNAKDKKELADMIHEGRFEELIRKQPIKKGDFFQIDPGTVHAIKGGTLILETQQSSDITYRLYDYGRLQNGKPRQLHLEKSIDVIKCPYEANSLERSVKTYADGAITETTLVDGVFYNVKHVAASGSSEVKLPLGGKFDLVSVVEGSATVCGEKVKKGDHFIVPADIRELTLAELSGAEFIISYPKEA